MLEDDHLDLDLVGELDDLLIAQHQRLLLADVEEGASLAAEVPDEVGLVPEDYLRMLAADRQLVGVAEVVFGGPSELGPRQVEHLALRHLLVFRYPVVYALGPHSRGVGLEGRKAAAAGTLLLRHASPLLLGGNRLPLARKGVSHRRYLYLLQRLQLQQVERQH